MNNYPKGMTASPPVTAGGPIGATCIQVGFQLPYGSSFGPMGMGSTTAPWIHDELLYHVQELPPEFSGVLECIKQRGRYGIKYRHSDQDSVMNYNEIIAVFNGIDYEFPQEPAKTWSNYGPASNIQSPHRVFGTTMTEVEALVMITAHHVSRFVENVVVHDLFKAHVSNPIWKDFLESSKNVFHVADVMLA